MPPAIPRHPLSRRGLMSIGLAAGAAQLLDGSCAAGAETTSQPSNLATATVGQFGAQGDGNTDDTAAFARALLSLTGGGTVFVPPGAYRISGHLTIPPGVTLRGSYGCVPSNCGIRDRGTSKPGEVGTVLLATAGRGQEQGTPFITVNANATLAGLTIYYPDQKPTGDPVAYPWAVALRGNNPAILDVELLNPYQGIDASDNARHTIRNITGQPLRRGIWVDGIYDIGRIENVHFNPWWNYDEPMQRWMMTHGEAFIFARTDWEYVFNTFALGYRYGYRFVESKHGACNGNFLGIGADGSAIAVQVDSAQGNGGLLITNGEFVSLGKQEAQGLVVGPNNQGVVSLYNCSFWGQFDNVVTAQGRGNVSLAGCILTGYDRHHTNEPAVVLDGPPATITGCQFLEHHSRAAVRITQSCASAVVTGNTTHGSSFEVATPSNPDPAQFAIGMNVATGQRRT